VKALWLLLCLGLVACADIETKPWYRADGSPGAPDQLDAAKATCRDEMQKAVAATNRAAALDRNVARPDIYDTCMSRLGYTDAKNVAATTSPGAPPAAAPGAPPSAAAGAPPGAAPAPAAECRKATDLRMWLPPCS
jgi:hypothetical protein